MPVGNEIFRGTKPRIEGSILCRRCGYDLKGIDPGGPCPECGIAIKGDRSHRRLGDTITDAPASYLNFLAMSCWMALATSVTSIGTYVVSTWMDEELAVQFIWLICCMCWAGTVFLLTADRRSLVVDPAELKAEWRRSRWVARFTQVGWVGAAGLSTMKLAVLMGANPGIRVFPGWPVVPASVGIMEIGIALCFLAGLTGLGFLCFHLASLAYWARDEALEMRLRTCAYFLCGGVPLLIGSFQFSNVGGGIGFAAFGLFLVMLFLVGGGWVMFLVGLGQLAMLSVNAVKSAEAEADRDMRMMEKMQAEREAAHARQYSAPPPVDLRPSTEQSNTAKPQGAYVPRPADVEGYEVRGEGG